MFKLRSEWNYPEEQGGVRVGTIHENNGKGGNFHHYDDILSQHANLFIQQPCMTTGRSISVRSLVINLIGWGEIVIKKYRQVSFKKLTPLQKSGPIPISLRE